jgi:pyruvate ferredoxin oxidoreductase delta subunit
MKLTPGAVVKGGTSLGYPTGQWRDQRPVIREELCKACGICEEICPDNAVHEVNEAFVIDYQYCKGCGLCAYECAAKAIDILPEEK